MRLGTIGFDRIQIWANSSAQMTMGHGRVQTEVTPFEQEIPQIFARAEQLDAAQDLWGGVDRCADNLRQAHKPGKHTPHRCARK
jgi:hypothetical protein